MKIFVDSGDAGKIVDKLCSGRCQGATTNPTLMHAAGISDYEGYARDLLERIDGQPISFEVFAEEFEEMERQARLIAKWGPNVLVKIPIMDIAGRSSNELIRTLSHDGIGLNVTAVFTSEQVHGAAEALTDGAPSIVSVFAGRIADTGRDPIPLVAEAVDICADHGSDIEVLWASQREVLNFTHAEQAGCQIITATPEFIDKYDKSRDKDLHQFSLETVQMFDRDAKAAGFQL